MKARLNTIETMDRLEIKASSNTVETMPRFKIIAGTKSIKTMAYRFKQWLETQTVFKQWLDLKQGLQEKLLK